MTGSECSPMSAAASTVASASSSVSTTAAHATPTDLHATDSQEPEAESGGGEEKSNKKFKSDVWAGYDAIRQVETNVVTSYGRKNEFEEYLEEALQPMDEIFDILGWWKQNGAKYPLVARMARDILAIPTSSVASESSFSHARRIITDSHASLLSESVERLMCIKDWLPDIKVQEFKAKIDKADVTEENNVIDDDELLLDPMFGALDDEFQIFGLLQDNGQHPNQDEVLLFLAMLWTLG